MTFRMSLVGPTRTVRGELTATHPVELVMDACDLLAEAGCRFAVSGFGQDDWPVVDVAYDFAVVLEDVPRARADLLAGRAAVLDFGGQGVERVVTMQPGPDGVRLTCSSRCTWKPSFEETALLPELLELLDDLLRQTFDSLAAAGVDPAPLVAWARVTG